LRDNCNKSLSDSPKKLALQIRNGADSLGASESAGAADVLRQLNNVLMIHNELRAKDAYAELKKYFNDPDSRASARIKELYSSRQASLEEIVCNEPLCGTNAKLRALCSLLKCLFEKHRDPRGMWLLYLYL
jgi:hypothetical protein